MAKVVKAGVFIIRKQVNYLTHFELSSVLVAVGGTEVMELIVAIYMFKIAPLIRLMLNVSAQVSEGSLPTESLFEESIVIVFFVIFAV